MVTILLGSGVLLGVAALVVDVGNLYAERGQLQSGADASAMAVAAECAAGSCDGGQDVEQQMLPVAQKYANANAKDGHTKITTICGTWGKLDPCPAPARGLAACIGAPPTDDYVEVRVQTEMSDGSTLLPPTFATALAGKAGYRGQSLATCARVAASSVCVTAGQETYAHTFNGAKGQATIKALKPLCPGEVQPVTLVSYTAPTDAFVLPQYVHDWEGKTITSSNMSASFDIDVPACYNQVDFVFRDRPINPLVDGGETYGDNDAGYDDKIGNKNYPPGNRSEGVKAWSHGGSFTCDPQPSETLTSNCDGTITVALTSGATANVSAVFTVTAGGTSQMKSVGPGTSTTVTIPASAAGSVTVEDNAPIGDYFHKTTGHWTKPGGC